VVEQTHRAAAVPESQRIGLIEALGVLVQVDLKDGLGAVGEPDESDELRVGRDERLADLQLPGELQ
jgi:hypothetical protein